MVGLASVWVCGGQGRFGCFPGSVGCECDLVGVVFWHAFAADGVLLDLPVVGVDCDHHPIVLVEISISGRFAGSLFDVGFLCRRAEFLDLAAECWRITFFLKWLRKN